MSVSESIVQSATLCGAGRGVFAIKNSKQANGVNRPPFFPTHFIHSFIPSPKKVNDQLKKRQTKKGIEASPWRIQA